MFTAALCITARTWKQTKRSLIEKCRKKMRHIYILDYYSTIKKNEIMPFATWMDPETVILSEVRQTKKDKYMISLLSGILKKGTKELIYKTEVKSSM